MSDTSYLSTQLPEFTRPPVVEVASSVQFAHLRNLDAAKLGALWLRFRDRYPRTEQHPPLSPVVESFGSQRVPRFGFSIEPAFPVPRLWFLDNAGTRLVQVQPNRLIVNWRQLDTGEDYPRYTALRSGLVEAFELFSAFVSKEGLGEIIPDQAELTYVNHIRAGERGKPRRSVSHFLNCWQEPNSRVLQGESEETFLRTQYVMRHNNEPIGRLFIELESAYTSADNVPIYVMNLIARGAPIHPTLEGALRFLDQAHDWIVQGFADLTTPEMHKQWERTR